MSDQPTTDRILAKLSAASRLSPKTDFCELFMSITQPVKEMIYYITDYAFEGAIDTWIEKQKPKA